MKEKNKSKIKKTLKKNLDEFVENLIKRSGYEVIGVKEKNGRFIFDTLENPHELRLDYDVTILPPKKYFLPQYEEIIKFNLGKNFDFKPQITSKPRIIIGIHPYDIIALKQADTVYLDSPKDDFYKKRRESTIIIGVDIQKISDRSFAGSMGTHVTNEGFDLMLTNIGKYYTITIGSDRGEELLNKYAEIEPATEEDVKKIQKVRRKIESKYKRKLLIDKNLWPNLLAANYDHPFWENLSRKCMECGSCTMVCPTCFCYDVIEEVSLNLKEGSRIRTWDSCLLIDFTRVASGEIFRKDVEERYRHRFYRKGNYLPARYGFVACVGCGRCGIACLPDIADPCKVMNDLSYFDMSENKERFYIKQKTYYAKEDIIHIPKSATIKHKERLTENEMWFEIELDDKKPLNHKPGQFVQVSVFGIGEAPISISSGPREDSSFELVVRRVGNVTNHLFKKESGDKIGIRGPFGNGFDVESFYGKHLLLSAGGLGIVPMRSLIQHAIKERKKFKDITILYGAKEPKEILFMDEIEEWSKVENVRCELTVDRCNEGDRWKGCVGLITTLYPKIKLDKHASENTIAVVIGPPVMYKYVIKCLQTLGIPDKNIYVSLERRMKCGVGKCGHCQINGAYVCKEGPVFNYEEIKDLPEAFE